MPLIHLHRIDTNPLIFNIQETVQRKSWLVENLLQLMWKHPHFIFRSIRQNNGLSNFVILFPFITANIMYCHIDAISIDLIVITL